MSFSSKVKSEICKIDAPYCCKYAECYGSLLCSKALKFTPFTYTSENEDVIEHIQNACKKFFGTHFSLSVSGQKRDIFTLTCKDSDAKIIKDAFLTSEKTVIQSHIIADDCCKIAFLRGAFLSCGYIDEPEKNYNLEFVFSDLTLAYELEQILEELGYTPKWSQRHNYAVLYFKESEKIEDLLTLMGATDKTLELAEIKVIKDMRNRLNRTTNFMEANIGKAVNAAVDQKNAINAIKEAGLYNQLSASLIEAAELRLRYPESSLQEILEESGCSLSKSGLNHRLQKLIKIANTKGLI